MFDGKVLLISPLPPPVGGIAQWTQDYVEYSEQKGVDVIVVDTSLLGKRANVSGNKRIIRDEIRRCLSIWKGICDEAIKKKVDVAHLNINCSPFGTIRDLISAILLKLGRVPFVVQCHCNIADQIGRSKISCLGLKVVFNLASSIIVLNEESYLFAKKIVKEKVVLIPNFIHINQFRKKKNINDRIRNVVFVGHIRHTKGIEEILAVAQDNADINFTLIGPITDEYSQSEISSKNRKNVKFTGSLEFDQISWYLDLADIFIFPSYTEGFSRALAEAMARGLPCIVTDVGANREMIENGGGIVVEPRNSEQLDAALKMMKCVTLRRKMSEWNYAKAYDNYRIDSVMVTIWKIYNTISDKSASERLQ